VSNRSKKHFRCQFGVKTFLYHMGEKKFKVSNESKKNLVVKWVKRNFRYPMGVNKL